MRHAITSCGRAGSEFILTTESCARAARELRESCAKAAVLVTCSLPRMLEALPEQRLSRSCSCSHGCARVARLELRDCARVAVAREQPRRALVCVKRVESQDGVRFGPCRPAGPHTVGACRRQTTASAFVSFTQGCCAHADVIYPLPVQAGVRLDFQSARCISSTAAASKVRALKALLQA